MAVFRSNKAIYAQIINDWVIGDDEVLLVEKRGITVRNLTDKEYLLILDIPYSETPDPTYMQDGIFFLGELPVIYGVWLRHRPGDPGPGRG